MSGCRYSSLLFAYPRDSLGIRSATFVMSTNHNLYGMYGQVEGVGRFRIKKKCSEIKERNRNIDQNGFKIQAEMIQFGIGIVWWLSVRLETFLDGLLTSAMI